jgi:tetratricopeptide (TPR) repeat protein
MRNCSNKAAIGALLILLSIFVLTPVPAFATPAEVACQDVDKLRRQGRFKEALELCQWAVQVDPKSAYACKQLALMQLVLGENEKACSSCNRALRLQPTPSLTADIRFVRGMVLQNLKKYNQAVEDFDYFISAKPDDRSGYTNRGFALYSLKEYDGAVKDLTRSLSFPQQPLPGTVFMRALAFHESKKYERAISDFSTLIEGFPTSPSRKSWLSLRARSYAALGQDEKAKEDRQLAEQQDKQGGDVVQLQPSK